MRLRQTLLAALTLLVAYNPPLRSQETNAETPRQQVQRRFEANSPRIGEPLPDVAAYDGRGKPFRLASLKGSHTVLVFGCLT